MSNDLSKYQSRQLALALAPQFEPEDEPVQGRRLPVQDTIKLLALSPHVAQELWGCGSGGVVRWIITPSQTSYKVWREEHGLFDGQPTCLLAQSHRVVVGHLGGGLSVFDVEKNVWTATKTDFPVRGLISDGESLTLALYDNGLLDLDRGSLLPTPDVPLTGAIVSGQPWIGTATGLYAYDGHDWKHWLEDCMILHLAASNDGAWAAWADGVARVATDGTVRRETFDDRPVQGIARGAAQTYFRIENTLYTVEDSGAILKWSSDKALSLLAANEYQLVSGLIHQLRWHSVGTSSPSRELIPRHDANHEAPPPPDIWTAVDTPSALWVQTLSGELWRKARTARLWHQIHVPLPLKAVAPLRHVVELNGQTLVCLEGCRCGLGLLEGHQIIFKQDIKYPQGLAIENGVAHVVAVDGLYQSADGTQWLKASNDK
jgi:hypothetical protein